MAVFDEILDAEKAQILVAGAENSSQVRIMSELRGKSNKICIKNNENWSFGGRLNLGKEGRCADFFLQKISGSRGSVGILCSLGVFYIFLGTQPSNIPWC